MVTALQSVMRLQSHQHTVIIASAQNPKELIILSCFLQYSVSFLFSFLFNHKICLLFLFNSMHVHDQIWKWAKALSFRVPNLDGLSLGPYTLPLVNLNLADLQLDLLTNHVHSNIQPKLEVRSFIEFLSIFKNYI
ncbi:hypothetical protein Pfo_022629 [Paulownia fortunei]|nr:hypothetical protein Pfo_022629 [Paulownia fortunei]